MKKFAAVIAAFVCSVTVLSGCGSRAQKPAETTAAETAVTSAAEQLPKEDFAKLPEGEEDRINTLSAAVAELFPDVTGRRMYAFKGIQTIFDGSAEKSCYVFDFYTYKKKKDEYTKIATVAQMPDSGTLFVLDENTGEYSQPPSLGE